MEGQGGVIALHLLQGDSDDFIEGVPIEDIGNGVPNVDHEHAETAVAFVGARAAGVFGFTGAGDGGESTVDEANKFSHADLFHRLCEGVATVFAALGFDVSGPTQLQEDAFHKLERQAVASCQFSDGHEGTSEGVRDAQLNHRAQCVLAFFRESHIGNCGDYRLHNLRKSTVAVDIIDVPFEPILFR